MIVALVPSLQTFGGVQHASRHLAAVFSAWAAEGRIPFRCLSLNDPPGVHRVRVGEIEFACEGFARAKASFGWAAMRLALRRPRLVLATHPYLGPVTLAMKLLVPRLAFVVAAHGIEVWNPLSPLRRQALLRASVVLAPSSYTACKLVAVQGLRQRCVRHLALAVDPGFIANSNGNHLPVDFPAGRVVLTVGRLASDERYKGVDTLIRALPPVLPRLPDLHLVVVGDGDDRPRLERQVAAAKLVPHVHFLGQLPAEALLACYRRCDVFAMPSGGEGFGLAYLEAMSLGKPVIGGSHGGAPELIQDGVSGLLVSHGDTTQLAAALERLLTDKQARSEIGLCGQQRALGLYQFDTFQARLTQIIEDVCAS